MVLECLQIEDDKDGDRRWRAVEFDYLRKQMSGMRLRLKVETWD